MQRKKKGLNKLGTHKLDPSQKREKIIVPNTRLTGRKTKNKES